MKIRTNLRTAAHYAVVSVLLLATLFPFYMTLINSWKHRRDLYEHFWGWPTHFYADNYATAARYLLPYMLNSVIVAGGIVLVVLILSSMAAFSFAAYDFPGKGLLYVLVIMMMMIPGFLLLVPQFVLVKGMGLLDSYAGQIFPPAAVGSAMGTMLIREFLAGLPAGLFESAQLDGAGSWRIYSRIALPLAKPILSVVGILTAISGWNNYIWPLVIISDEKLKPVILVLGTISGTIEQGMGLQLAGYAFASLPFLVLFLFATKPFISGLTSGAIKG
ncbi:carbohydrate ABC transporter permease [Paenibacillus sacheonensis]|uniref:ABC transporter permease subunit n=1 Tax=Paenibacillus sacheonensis TaxID=742054 RepID=A0A7X4YQV5_9BACL|nr:carbohydrate ABC transporter permease [Paenibacillus sacheonensis]MBM7567192.1 ABC-type glycerol-3-phosphate transport system permease component [Paenibacillus sacheonensis]NBC70882.1 ABC transporter permease subunit [Paenibacillus sacheonensis]